jgi:predicted transcriptional regulator
MANHDTHSEDGWPDEYHDPRDRPHPETLRITVEPFEQMREQTLEAARTAADGEAESPPAVVSFASVEELRKILTERRIELLRALISIDGAAASISALADDLDRDYRPVHDDVGVLDQYGLVFLVEEGRAKRPFVPYQRVHLDVELAADREGEEPAPA